MKTVIKGLGSAAVVLTGAAVAQAEPVHLTFNLDITESFINPNVSAFPTDISQSALDNAYIDVVLDLDALNGVGTGTDAIELTFNLGDEFEYVFVGPNTVNETASGLGTGDHFRIIGQPTLIISLLI